MTVAGVQVDCAVTRDFLSNSRTDPWGLVKDARLRLWPAGSGFMATGTYVYPVKQRWFATTTQMSNEPSFVDGSETPWSRKIYYHYGLDTGGAEGMTEVVAATAGLVVVRGKSAMPGYEKNPYTEVGYDGVIVLDERGWFHWYFHLYSIDSEPEAGREDPDGPAHRADRQGRERRLLVSPALRDSRASTVWESQALWRVMRFCGKPTRGNTRRR